MEKNRGKPGKYPLSAIASVIVAGRTLKPGLGDIQKDRPPLSEHEREVRERKKIAKKRTPKMKVKPVEKNHGKVKEYDKKIVDLINLIREERKMEAERPEPKSLREKMIQSVIDYPEATFTLEKLYRFLVVKYYGVEQAQAEKLSVGEPAELGIKRSGFYTKTRWINNSLCQPFFPLLHRLARKIRGKENIYQFNLELKEEVRGFSFNQLVSMVAKAKKAGVKEKKPAEEGIKPLAPVAKPGEKKEEAVQTLSFQPKEILISIKPDGVTIKII